MRLAAQKKLGFYPADPLAVASILSHLFVGDDVRAATSILDPCCGEGAAIAQIAEGLSVPHQRVYAIELDAARAEAAKARMPDANVLGPASFLGTRVSQLSFGLAYVNPPFDDEIGGGRRYEHSFTLEATRLLVPGGILVLVAPLRALRQSVELQKFLDCMYEDEQLFVFPDCVRKYQEFVFIGHRRKTGLPHNYSGTVKTAFRYYDRDPAQRCGCPILGEVTRKWVIPKSRTPREWAKSALTDQEIVSLLDHSPLLDLLKPPPTNAIPRPPLPLHSGHVSLLLASGLLNGVMAPPGEPPHVVRGTARKTDFVASRDTSVNPQTGVTTEKVVVSQRIELTVRVVTASGEMKTFGQTPAAVAAPGPEIAIEAAELAAV